MILNNHVADLTHSPKLLTTTLYNVHSADDDAAIWLKDATIKAFTKKKQNSTIIAIMGQQSTDCTAHT